MGRVLICHRDPYFREGLAKVLRKLPREHVVAVGDSSDAVAIVANARPDVLLTELETVSGQGALELYRDLQEWCPSLQAPVIICPPERLVPTITIPLIEQGAGCIIVADAQPDEFILVVSMVTRGVWPRYNLLANDLHELAGLVRRGMEPCERCGYQTHMLTAREREIVEMVSLGNSNRLIARRLHLSEATVKNHMHAAFRRLNVSNRAALVAEATRLGLIGSPAAGPIGLPLH